MILANQIFSLYDAAFENPDILKTEINTEIVKTWTETIKPDIPNGNKNYEVSHSSYLNWITEMHFNQHNAEEIFKILQNDINVAQSAFKDYLIPFSFDMKGRNAHILRKGTPDGLATFKAACKKNGVTIGISLFAAVHWAMAKFDSSRDPICFADVNLRHRVSGNNLDKESEIYSGSKKIYRCHSNTWSDLKLGG